MKLWGLVALAAGAAGAAYLLTRKGSALVIYGLGRDEGTLRGMARSVGTALGARVVGVSSAAQVYSAVSEVQSLQTLVLVGHGTTRAFFSNFSSPVTPAGLANALRGRLAPGAVIGLAGCRAGADTSEEDWAVGCWGPGGAQSFAGQLRDLLAGSGEVRAHSTTGSAVANPAVRVFPIGPSYRGTAGKSLLDLLYGNGSWQQASVRNAWRDAFRGKAATQFISGIWSLADARRMVQ